MNDTETKEMLCELLRLFYDKDWVSGTGGGICGPTEDGNLFLAPTGVHKERIQPPDFFVVSPANGVLLRAAADPFLHPSECNSIFCAIVRMRGARSVMHSHALSSVLAADIAGERDHIAIRHLEMLKGIRGVSNRDQHLIPVIRNTPKESELVDQVISALNDARFQSSFAILVRDHGAYIWGDDVWETKRHAEVYHFLFEAAVSRRR
jgi:methylthioribulose-1-phosphate dehydratase